MDITTIGEVLIDLTQTEANAQNIPMFAANPGGAPANVAVAAARLGAEAAFIGKVGQDGFGTYLQQVLNQNGVDTAGLRTGSNFTTMAIVTVDKSGERDFRFVRGADKDLRSEEVPRSALDSTKLLHIGSVSLTAEPARSATLAAARYARERGGLVSYDPNYRANLWPDEATAVSWMKQPLCMTDVLKLSDEELPLLTGTDDLEEGSRRLAAEGISLVLVTLGGQGTFYRLGERTGTVPAVRVRVADTNGAGDTFFGALLSRLSRRAAGPLAGLTGEELEGHLRFANRAAALTCSRSGAIPAMPTLVELEHD